MLVTADMRSATAVYVLERLFRLVGFLKACFESWKDLSQLVEVQQQLFEYLEGLSRQVEVCQQQFMYPEGLSRLIRRRAPRFSVSIASKVSPSSPMASRSLRTSW